MRTLILAAGLAAFCSSLPAQVCVTHGNAVHGNVIQGNVVHGSVGHHNVVTPTKVITSTVVADQVQHSAGDVFVVENHLPTPLVPQGSSAFRSLGVPSYQANAIPLFDPNQYFQTELQLQKAASSTSEIRSARTAELVERVTALQAPAIAQLAQGHAAQMVLQAAGLVQSSANAAPASFLITQDAHGQMVIKQVDPNCSSGSCQATQGQPQAQAPQAPAQPVLPLMNQFCANCHGEQSESPSGGFAMGVSGESIKNMKAEWFDLVAKVQDGSMLPASAPQPSQEQRANLLNELRELIANSQ